MQRALRALVLVTACATAIHAADAVLRTGDRGPAVAELQDLLNGWRRREGVPPIGRDGDFGGRTAAAVARFQRTRGITADGVVAAETWTALRAPFATDRLGRIDPLSAPWAGDVYTAPGASTATVRVRTLAAIDVAPGLRARPTLFQSGMAIDADGAGDAWRSDPWGQPATSLRYPDGRSLDPTEVPYFVLPIGFTALHPDVRLGDLAAIVFENRIVYAIWGDAGPRGKLGEASIAAARALGINADPVRGGTGAGVTYVVFPGSGSRTALAPAEIARRGRALFVQAGGNP